MEQKFKKEIQSLEKVFEFLDRFMSAHNIDASVAFPINLAVEEFFTNMVKYNRKSRNDISISAEKKQHQVVVQLVDHDVDRFDVTKTGEVNTEQPLEDRKIGGLGIHISKQLLDSLSYEYSDNNSRITLVKNLEK